MSSYRPRRFVGVPCPGCISRAPWIPVDHTDPNALPRDIAWTAKQERPENAILRVESIAWFDHVNPKRATFKRVYDVAGNATVFYKRDPKHINTARKGYVCSPCADIEEGAY